MVARRLEDDLLAIGRPAYGEIDGGVPGEAARDAAGGGHDEDIFVTVVVAGEGDGCAVGGELGVCFDAQTGGEADGFAAGAGDAPEVAGVGEDDLCFAESWFLEEVGGGGWELGG